MIVSLAVKLLLCFCLLSNCERTYVLTFNRCRELLLLPAPLNSIGKEWHCTHQLTKAAAAETSAPSRLHWNLSLSFFVCVCVRVPPKAQQKVYNNGAVASHLYYGPCEKEGGGGGRRATRSSWQTAYFRNKFSILFVVLRLF